MNYQAITSVLNDGLVLATGCTEPGALALTAAAAAAHLGEPVRSLHTFASGNIIKNAYSAGIPGTQLVGIEYAVAIGAIVAKPEKQLQVINGLTQQQIDAACALVDAKQVVVELAKGPQKLYIEVEAKGEHNTARAIIANVHTNIIYIEENGKAILDKRNEEQSADGGYSDKEIKEMLSVAKIFEYATTVDLSLLDKIRLSIDVNSAISDEGMNHPYGLCIGRGILDDMQKGYRGDSLTTYAMQLASAGADARMAGADAPVVSNSGSGNQGIACTMPVVAVAKKLGVSDEQMMRAVTLSNLMGIYIKSQFGRLSAFCGATVAGIGSSCGSLAAGSCKSSSTVGCSSGASSVSASSAFSAGSSSNAGGSSTGNASGISSVSSAASSSREGGACSMMVSGGYSASVGVAGSGSAYMDTGGKASRNVMESTRASAFMILVLMCFIDSSYCLTAMTMSRPFSEW